MITGYIIPAIQDKSLSPVAEPQSGEILIGSEVLNESEITVKASGNSAYFVKLKNRAGDDILAFYVRANATVTVGVPAEYFYVYFASGDTWYGLEHYFGANTAYAKDDEICNFGKYSYEYTLYPVNDGNFSETPVNKSEFE